MIADWDINALQDNRKEKGVQGNNKKEKDIRSII